MPNDGPVTMHTIHAVYMPNKSERTACHIYRTAAGGYRPSGPAWPTDLKVGDEVLVECLDGRIYHCLVEELDIKEESATVSQIGPTVDKPMPPIEGGTITLPKMAGHAHGRRWSKGDVVEVHGARWVVKGARDSRLTSNRTYTLVPATERQWANRPARKAMHSERQAVEAIGTAIHLPSGEWMEVKSIARTAFHGALGRDYTYWVVGRICNEKKALKINAKASK